MSYYAMIYSPDGEPFEVPHDRAAELVLNHGWTRQQVQKLEPVKVAPPPVKAQIVTPAKPAEADVKPAPQSSPDDKH